MSASQWTWANRLCMLQLHVSLLCIIVLWHLPYCTLMIISLSSLSAGFNLGESIYLFPSSYNWRLCYLDNSGLLAVSDGSLQGRAACYKWFTDVWNIIRLTNWDLRQLHLLGWLSTLSCLVYLSQGLYKYHLSIGAMTWNSLENVTIEYTRICVRGHFCNLQKKN